MMYPGPTTKSETDAFSRGPPPGGLPASAAATQTAGSPLQAVFQVLHLGQLI